MRVATIDIGTNSVLLLVAESSAAGLGVVFERATLTRLGQGVDRSRRLRSDAVERTLACLEEYAALIANADTSHLDVVGTSAMRDADGGNEFVDRVEQILGTRPRVISGDEEAALTFEGAASGLDIEGECLVFDVGGGSTEVIFGRLDGRGACIQHGKSLDVGSVRLTERHIRSDPPTAAELEAVAEDVRRALSQIGNAPSTDRLIGVAGTLTTLAAIHHQLSTYDSAVVHGAELTAAEVHELGERLARMSHDERVEVPGLEPQRADVIVAGTTIVTETMRWCSAKSVVVSDRGVRWGVAQRLAAKKMP